MKYVQQNHVTQWFYTSGKSYDDPFNEVELSVLFRDADGEEKRVPAFWAGEQTWGVRYASPNLGTHHHRSICSDVSNDALHGQEGILEVTPYEGVNPLFRHGKLRVAADRRHLEHHDGTPFFWLGDTWWMGLCQRLKWPGGFRELTADRVAKGFSLVQIVAGLYPDMEPFDERGANEAGFPWEPDFSRINPAYFDMADLRIAYMVQNGLAPCVVGCWGYFLDFAGDDVLRKNWRNLVARWGAYPIVWCVAGEALMLYYVGDQGPDDAEQHIEALRSRWSDLTRALRSFDPYHNPITIHPTRYGRDQVDDPAILDLEMLQTGHNGYLSLADTVDFLEESLAREPTMPVFVSEVNYEGIMESSREEMQRFLFWTCLLSGACGHTYGANGLWQVNTREQPYGKSPHGTSWGDRPWDEAYQLPGSGQIGLGKQLLERYPWWRFEIHAEWVEPHQAAENRHAPYAAGIPGEVRVIFIPALAIWSAWKGDMVLKELDAGTTYHAFYFDPRTGTEYGMGTITADEEGGYTVPKPPIFQDWVFVLEDAIA
ncbi:MAG: DUF4038 domain-containing protein [Chloroflexi bacterium]|nr:DUF4038 domain-containing protein [Chloroflexota bacterium]